MSIDPPVLTVTTPATASVWAGQDPDAGNDIFVSFSRLVDGRVVQEGEVGALSPGHAAKGRTVAVIATPNDGTDEGEPVSSLAATVANSPPTIAAVAIDPPAAARAATGASESPLARNVGRS